MRIECVFIVVCCLFGGVNAGSIGDSLAALDPAQLSGALCVDPPPPSPPVCGGVNPGLPIDFPNNVRDELAEKIPDNLGEKIPENLPELIKGIIPQLGLTYPSGRPETLPVPPAVPSPEFPDVGGSVIVGGGVVGQPDGNGGVIVGGGVIGVHPDEDTPSLPNEWPSLPNFQDNDQDRFPNMPSLPDSKPGADGVVGGIIGALRPDGNGNDGRFPNLPNNNQDRFPNLPNLQDNDQDRFPNLPNNNQDRFPNLPSLPNSNQDRFPNMPSLPDSKPGADGVVGGIIGALRPDGNGDDSRFPNLPSLPNNDQNRFPNLPNSNQDRFPNMPSLPNSKPGAEGVVGGVIGVLRGDESKPDLTAHISMEGEIEVHVDPDSSLCGSKCCSGCKDDSVAQALEIGKETIGNAIQNRQDNTSLSPARVVANYNDEIQAFKERHFGNSIVKEEDDSMLIELVPSMSEETWRDLHLMDNVRTELSFSESSKPSDGYHYGTEIDSASVVKVVRWAANNDEFVKATARAYKLGLLSAISAESGGYVCKFLEESKFCIPTIDLMKMTLMFRKRLESVLRQISNALPTDTSRLSSSKFRGTMKAKPHGDPEHMPHPSEYQYWPTGYFSWR